jgi:hypothetical protein
MRMYWRAGLSVTSTNTCSTPPGMLTTSPTRTEPTTVRFVKVSAFEDTKELRLGMPVWRRAFPRRVDGFDDGECAAARRGCHADLEIKSDCRDCDWRIRAFGVNKGYAHCPAFGGLLPRSPRSSASQRVCDRRRRRSGSPRRGQRACVCRDRSRHQRLGCVSKGVCPSRANLDQGVGRPPRRRWVYEGPSPGTRVAINAFDSLAAVQASRNSDQFKEACKVGDKYAKFRSFAIEGLSQQ